MEIKNNTFTNKSTLWSFNTCKYIEIIVDFIQNNRDTQFQNKNTGQNYGP